MKKAIKQCVGIDCAKDDLAVSLGTMNEQFEKEIISNKVFANSKSGYAAMMNWKTKLQEKDLEIVFVVEATGVYHEQVSLFLHKQGEHISVVLPNKIRHYCGTENIKTVTDKVMAQTMLCNKERKITSESKSQQLSYFLRLPVSCVTKNEK